MDKKKILQIATMAVVVIAVAIIMVYIADKNNISKRGLENSGAKNISNKEVKDKYAISIKSAPTVQKLADGKSARVLWEISGPEKTISHTAIYYDFVSHSGKLDKNATAYLAGYPSYTIQYASKEEDIPKTFDADLPIKQIGTIYYRAHAIIEGKHYWTDEKSINIIE